MEFTEQQEKALNHKEGPCLVLAVPGAGKTTVLLARLHRLIQDGVDPYHIASITFSRLQAEDMKARYLADLEKRGINPAQQALPVFSTIHAFCFHILQSYSQRQGKKLEVIEGSDRYNKYQAVSRLFFEINHRPMTEDERDDFFRIDGYLKNSLIDYSAYRRKTGERFPHFEELSQAYEQFKAERELVDFDDMLVRSLQLLDSCPPILHSLQKRFTYLEVDEAQDTSLIQLRIIQKIAEPENNLFMVADDDQAIYGFRGANPQYLLHFKEVYPHAQTLTMEDNHRSNQTIVRSAGQFIQENQNRYKKRPVTDSEEREKIRILLTRDLRQEYQKLMDLLPRDLEYGNAALIFRNNISMIGLMDQLERAGLPYHARGQANRFFNHPILKDLENILLLAHDPRDVETFSKIYYKLNAYLKKVFIQKIARMDPYDTVFDRLRALPETQNTFYREKIRFLERQMQVIGRLPLDDAISQINQYLGYGDYLRERARQSGRSISTDLRVMETAEILAAGLERPSQWQEKLDRLRAAADKKEGKAPLTLSTVHGAKGLEFDTVYVVDLIQGEFPSTMAVTFHEMGNDDLLEEERRLFYVAMTRAKTRLRLFGRKSVNGQPAEYSQFIDELAKGAKGRK